MELYPLVVLLGAGLAMVAMLALAALAYRAQRRHARLQREQDWLREAEPRVAARLAVLRPGPAALPGDEPLAASVQTRWPRVERVARAPMAHRLGRAERRRQLWRDASTALVGFALLGSGILLLGQALPRGDVQGVTAPPGVPADAGDPLFPSGPAVVGTTLQPGLSFGAITPSPGPIGSAFPTPVVTGPTGTPTVAATPQPTARPPATPRPTSPPTARPTQAPTPQPTAAPTASPEPPTPSPAPSPTPEPTAAPTPTPTLPLPTPTLPLPTSTLPV